MIRQDLHVHTHLSSCSSDPYQTLPNILSRATELGLNQICLTDHFWDDAIPGASDWYKPQNLEHIRQSLSEIPEHTGEVEVFFGCETEFNGRVGISRQTALELDFVLIPISHFHMKGFVRPMQVNGADEVADLWLTRYEQLLQIDLPWSRIGLAHVSDCCVGALQEEFLHSLLRKPLTDIFKRTADMGIAIEINGSSLFEGAAAQMNRKIYGLMKECGCVFTLGSDAHSRQKLDVINKAVEFAELLSLDSGDIKKLQHDNP